MNAKENKKVIVILGPTASGKSDLAVKIAREVGGEVISADSRQVYTELDIGTGKITKREMKGVPHHLLDVVSPKKQFTVEAFKHHALKEIDGVFKRNHVPIICGGTGFYIQSIVDGTVFPEVPPNKKLREKLSKKSTKELFSMLKKLDPKRVQTIDGQNPVRLIRAIEIAESLGSVPKLKARKSEYEFLQIGIQPDEKTLRNNIHLRLLKRIKAGMIQEVRGLHAEGLSWKRMEALGLEYRYVTRYLQGKINRKEMIDSLEREIWQYGKRQKQWFKRDERIRWFEPTETKLIQKEVEGFLRV